MPEEEEEDAFGFGFEEYNDPIYSNISDVAHSIKQCHFLIRKYDMEYSNTVYQTRLRKVLTRRAIDLVDIGQEHYVEYHPESDTCWSLRKTPLKGPAMFRLRVIRVRNALLRPRADLFPTKYRFVFNGKKFLIKGLNFTIENFKILGRDRDNHYHFVIPFKYEYHKKDQWLMIFSTRWHDPEDEKCLIGKFIGESPRDIGNLKTRLLNYDIENTTVYAQLGTELLSCNLLKEVGI